MKKSTKNIILVLAIVLVISMTMTIIAAIRTTQLGVENGGIIPELYIYSIVLGILLIVAGKIISNKNPQAQKVLNILGIYNIAVTVIVFAITKI